MTDPNRITLYYSPQSRATGTRVLLEELGAPYDLHVLLTDGPSPGFPRRARNRVAPPF